MFSACLIEHNLFFHPSFIYPPSVNEGYCNSLLMAIQLVNVSFLNYLCRHGTVNGAIPYGRSDSLSQQTGLAGRSLLSRDSDHNLLYNEKRERAIGSDRERVNLRAVNKYVLTNLQS